MKGRRSSAGRMRGFGKGETEPLRGALKDAVRRGGAREKHKGNTVKDFIFASPHGVRNSPAHCFWRTFAHLRKTRDSQCLFAAFLCVAFLAAKVEVMCNS